LFRGLFVSFRQLFDLFQHRCLEDRYGLFATIRRLLPKPQSAVHTLSQSVAPSCPCVEARIGNLLLNAGRVVDLSQMMHLSYCIELSVDEMDRRGHPVMLEGVSSFGCNHPPQQIVGESSSNHCECQRDNGD
jgi:hypothetical protein